MTHSTYMNIMQRAQAGYRQRTTPCAPRQPLPCSLPHRRRTPPARLQPLGVAAPSNGTSVPLVDPNNATNTSSARPAHADQPAASSAPRAKACKGTLLVQCPDQKGVIAALAQLLFGFGCNIVESDQYTDVGEDMFFQRIRFDYSGLVVGVENVAVLETAVADLAKRYSMDWKVQYDWQTPNVALLVSKMDHCLYDLLIRHQAGDLHCNIPVIISNHPDLGHISKQFGIDFVHLPIARASASASSPAAPSKTDQEAQIEAILADRKIDLVILARYMQIFSQEFCARHWRHTINIHHSFLPAFEGAKPYHRAHERGVKIIGATAHYATSELDAGPIIEQDITRITHRDAPVDMVRKGRDLERLVLARAVRWHLQGRVLVHKNKTVVFED